MNDLIILMTIVLLCADILLFIAWIFCVIYVVLSNISMDNKTKGE